MTKQTLRKEVEHVFFARSRDDYSEQEINDGIVWLMNKVRENEDYAIPLFDTISSVSFRKGYAAGVAETRT
tara:strand:+ start:10272 stop:10484 length:213 start_codon:yes stop_codon:yes gene_type:complete